MTDLVPSDRQPARRQTGGADPQVVAQTLRKAQAQWVALFDDWTALMREHRDMLRVMHEAHMSPPRIDYVYLERQRQTEIQSARGVLNALAPPEVMTALQTRLQAASNTAFDGRRCRVLVGLLIDGFPNARPHDGPTYFEAVMHELETADVSPAAVAKACSEIRRTATFPPSVAELLKAATEAQATLVAGARSLGRALDVAEAAQSALTILETRGEISEAESKAFEAKNQAERMASRRQPAASPEEEFNEAFPPRDVEETDEERRARKDALLAQLREPDPSGERS